MQDIVPKKSIREITKPHMPGVTSSQSQYKPVEPKMVVQEVKDSFEEYPHVKFGSTHKEKGRGWIFIVFLLLVVGGVGTFLHFQKSATIYITTTQETLTFKDTEINIPLTDLIVLTATTTSVIDIITTAGTPTLTKAKGTVTVYNSNSTEQVLIASTRLETPNGKIYRLDNKITVPKASVVAGKTTPGSIQALISADKVGESYNISQVDFTFPGLVGSPRYKNVYARSKGAITGGSETSAKIINEKDKNTKIESFTKESADSLEIKLRAQKIEDVFIIKNPALTTVFEKTSDTKGTVTLSNSMTVVDTKKLATLLTKTQKQNASRVMEFAQDASVLDIEYVSSDKTSAQIKVNGAVSVRSYIDQVSLKALLAGKPFNQFREIIKQIEGVDESRFSSKPFWATTFPQVTRIFVEQK